MMLSLARSCEGSSRSVDIISASFPTVGGEELHEILVLGESLLKNSAVTVGGAGSSGGALFSIFAWC